MSQGYINKNNKEIHEREKHDKYILIIIAYSFFPFFGTEMLTFDSSYTWPYAQARNPR